MHAESLVVPCRKAPRGFFLGRGVKVVLFGCARVFKCAGGIAQLRAMGNDELSLHLTN
jgi:hypothetical protein